MSELYKKGEIVWAKIQGYSWWPGRITKIKLKLNIGKNRLGKIILQYEKEPYFYVTFFPNDSISKVKLKYIKKFIEGYKLSAKSKKGKKLTKAIDIATRTFLEENPDLDMETKKNIFNIKLFSKKKFPLLRQFRAIAEEEEEQNGENDIQSFIESEMNECEKYKNELKEKNSKRKYIGNKRKKSNDIKDESEIVYTDSENSENNFEHLNKKDLNKKCNRELKKYSNELFKTSVEVKRKNTINNIINIFNGIENIINKYDIDYNFDIIKDLIIILNNYNINNNEIIMQKSISLNKDLTDKLINNYFKYDNDFIKQISLYTQEQNILYNKFASNLEEIGNKIGLEIDNINKNNLQYIIPNEKDKTKKVNKQLVKVNIVYKEDDDIYLNNNKTNDSNNNYKFGSNQELTDELTLNNNFYNGAKGTINNNGEQANIWYNNLFNGNEPFLTEFINNQNFFNKKPDGQLYPDNFFKEIYLKEGINPKSELLRKKICLQLFNVLKLVLPFCQEDIFKKNVIFLEYLARHIDPSFGNHYMTIINMIYNRIKSEAVKIKNKNKNKK
jgi:hypothetical protein